MLQYSVFGELCVNVLQIKRVKDADEVPMVCKQLLNSSFVFLVQDVEQFCTHVGKHKSAYFHQEPMFVRDRCKSQFQVGNNFVTE